MADAPHTSNTTRVEAFSDGVFAIAITLLVLEIHVPAPDATQHGRTLLTALRQLWPSYLGYVLSFVTIGIMWANHHTIFRYVRRADRYFVLINVCFSCVSRSSRSRRHCSRPTSPSLRDAPSRSPATARPW